MGDDGIRKLQLKCTTKKRVKTGIQRTRGVTFCNGNCGVELAMCASLSAKFDRMWPNHRS